MTPDNAAALALITGQMGGVYPQYPQIIGNYPMGGNELDALDRMALAGAAPAQDAAIQAAIAQKLAGNSALVQMGRPTKAREYPLGFDSGVVLIPPGGSAPVINRPQVVFKTERLVVPSDIGGSFVIDDLVVGKNSQFASNSVGVPARVFDENGVGVRLAGDTAQISQDIIIKVTNISGADARFRAAVIGPAIE